MKRKSDGLKLVKICDLNTGETAKRWLVDGLWDYAGTGILFAPPKMGKTWLLLELAVSVATGTAFLDRYKVMQGKVFLHSPEGSHHDLKERVRQICERKGLSIDTAELSFLDENYFAIDNPDDQQRLEEKIDEEKPILLCFDPLVECFGGNENISDDVRRFSSWFTRLARQYSVATILVHHTTKSGKGMRGSSALFGFGTAYWGLEKKDGHISLNFEFKNRSPLKPLPLKLQKRNGLTSFVVTSKPRAKKEVELVDKIIKLLNSQYPASLTQDEIRRTLGGRYNKYPSALKYLLDGKLITRFKNGGYKAKK